MYLRNCIHRHPVARNRRRSTMLTGGTCAQFRASSRNFRHPNFRCAVLPNLAIEAILDPDHPNQLRLHTWDGRKFVTAPNTRYRGCTYTPAPIAKGLAQAVRFSRTSRPFGSAAKLTSSMLELLSHYARLQHDAAALLVAFAVASWFPDCVPVAPVLYLLGPENEASLMLRLLGCLCRRPVLLGDIDMAAFGVPGELDQSAQSCAARHANLAAVMPCRARLSGLLAGHRELP